MSVGVSDTVCCISLSYPSTNMPDPTPFSDGSRGSLELCSVLILVDLNTQKDFFPHFLFTLMKIVCSPQTRHTVGICLGSSCLFVVVISSVLGLNGAWTVHARLVIMLFDVAMIQPRQKAQTASGLDHV